MVWGFLQSIFSFNLLRSSKEGCELNAFRWDKVLNQVFKRGDNYDT